MIHQPSGFIETNPFNGYVCLRKYAVDNDMLYSQSWGSEKDDYQELCEGVVLAHIKMRFSPLFQFSKTSQQHRCWLEKLSYNHLNVVFQKAESNKDIEDPLCKNVVPAHIKLRFSSWSSLYYSTLFLSFPKGAAEMYMIPLWATSVNPFELKITLKVYMFCALC
jgi:hypothetical protein